MNEKWSIEKLLEDQITIFRNNGMKNQTVTVAIPQVTLDKRISCPDVEIASIILKLVKVLNYEPKVLNTNVFYSDSMKTILVTFLFLG